jgi:hypothetical protein
MPKGHRHENIEVTEAAATTELATILKDAFIGCFQYLQER